MTNLLLTAAAFLATTISTGARAETQRLSVAFVVWDGMELIESMGPAHVFSFAGDMDCFTVSKGTESIRSEFVTLVPDYTFESCPAPDVIVLPGGSIWTPMTDDATRRWLSKHVPQATLVVSVCNSAMLLADLGLLDGKEATCGDSNIDDIMLLGRERGGLHQPALGAQREHHHLRELPGRRGRGDLRRAGAAG